MEEPGFWDNPEKSTRMVREAKNLKDEVETFRELEQEFGLTLFHRQNKGLILTDEGRQFLNEAELLL